MSTTLGLSDVKRNLLEQYLNRKNVRESIRRRRSVESAPLSFAQEQVWLHTQMAGDVPLYNETITVHRHGPLHIDVLERCLCEIIRRHEIWRTTFDVDNSKPVQIVHPAPGDYRLPFQDLSNVPATERDTELKRLAGEEVRRPFDLKVGPLLRALLVRTNEEAYSLFVTFHQIVFDAVSAYQVFLP